MSRSLSFRSVLIGFLLLFILGDTAFTFVQFYRMPLDGDLAALAIPAPRYQAVFSDPFGIELLNDHLSDYRSVSPVLGRGSKEALKPQARAGVNRFFSHWATSYTFLHLPIWLQTLTGPINSIYLTGTLVKLFIHWLLIWIIWRFALADRESPYLPGLLVLGLIVSLFQTHGNVNVMGLIDSAPTYNFFYSLPLAGLLLVLLPFYRWHVNGQYPARPTLLALIIMPAGFILSFSGPLIAPCILLIGTGIFLKRTFAWWSAAKVKLSPLDLALAFFMLLSLYSFWLGGFNAENKSYPFSLVDRYARLGEGVIQILTKKPGLTLLILLNVTNYQLLKRWAPAERSLRKFILFLAGFCLMYLLLLPWGGFREYRPLFVRHDTLLPISLSLIIALATGTYRLLLAAKPGRRRVYPVAILILTIFFTAQDYYAPHYNACERVALQQLADSSEKENILNPACHIMAWGLVTEPDILQLNNRLLRHYGILKEDQSFRYGK